MAHADIPWNGILHVTNGTPYQIPRVGNSNCGYTKKVQNVRHSGVSHNYCVRQTIADTVRDKITLYMQNKMETMLEQFIDAANSFEKFYGRPYEFTEQRFDCIMQVYLQTSRISSSDRSINLPSFFELAKIGSMYFQILDIDTQNLLNLVNHKSSTNRYNKISLALQSTFTNI